MPEKLKVPRTY